ncbi:DUF3316 domain-containing protein [Photobacterium swingsii]|uniref:DUF3316 domain-containing protein n=1 Tax=Photobacterium swingsii TaxID=680026 RepID=A0A0J8VC16_9GAMM|nr:DUF3316 domain-containing protein [Photobacterium swingsii]KMV30080.1 hypothetical protein AB733_14270 [Photobacterium swingsii]PSW23008.1 DUF3316 domain-containing protein [Photobacterium swingsii]
MNKLLVALTTLLISCSTFAFSWDSKQENINLTAGVSDSREGAYQLGRQFASNIEQSSPKKLKRTLGIYEYGLKTNSIQIDDSQIEVDEFSTAQGDVKYRAVVNVGYSYDIREANNR